MLPTRARVLTRVLNKAHLPCRALSGENAARTTKPRLSSVMCRGPSEDFNRNTGNPTKSRNVIFVGPAAFVAFLGFFKKEEEEKEESALITQIKRGVLAMEVKFDNDGKIDIALKLFSYSFCVSRYSEK
jgi:hypothetical protein